LGFTENIYQHLKATFWEKEKVVERYLSLYLAKSPGLIKAKMESKEAGIPPDPFRKPTL